MDVILLERIARLGQMGDVVRVRDGFARNYLLPQGKALRANKDNMARFEKERAQLEAQNLERKGDAEAVAGKLNGRSFVAIRQAGDTGQLYGSVSTRDIAELLTAGGFTLARTQVELNAPIKTLGLHEIRISLHPEVQVTVSVNVARSQDEAARQARGEDVTLAQAIEEQEAARAAAEALFEDEELAQEAVRELGEDTLDEAESPASDATGEDDSAKR